MGKRRKRGCGAGGGVEVVEAGAGAVAGPRCLHGPMLLLASARGRLYTCSCSRQAECIADIPERAWESTTARDKNHKYRTLYQHDKHKDWLTYQQASDGGQSEVVYCVSCDAVCAATPTSEGAHAAHETARVSPELARHPSRWLPPLHSDTQHAQYHFSQPALDTILRFLLDNRIRSVVCVGAPSLHEALAALPDPRPASLLLDLDARYRHFCSPRHFFHYNMYNNHFFDERDVDVFNHHLQTFSKDKACVVIDPPFGGRLEPLASTLRSIGSACPGQLHTLLVFPYFAEPHIVNLLPHLHMHHYQVRYRNHGRLGAAARRSVVRLYSDLPRGSLCLRAQPGYRYCAPCAEWVAEAAAHCPLCDACTARDGRPYVHCAPCGRCVKPTYTHCATCRRCCLPRHECGFTPPVRCCYNCKGQGHKRSDCPLLPTNTPAAHTHKRKRKHNR